MNRDNWISARSSTRIHNRPGGNSSFSLGWSSSGLAGPQGNGQGPVPPANQNPAPMNPAMQMQQGNPAMQMKQGNPAMPMQQGNQAMQMQAKPMHMNMHAQQMPVTAAPQVAAQAALSGVPRSHSTDVMAFTRACDQPVAPRPTAMTVQEVDFITKMILDELLELQATVRAPAQAKAAMQKTLQEAEAQPLLPQNDVANIIAEQGDAFVDIWYYSLNAACKKGVNLCSIFDKVHAANMAKIDPRTGKCNKRADGKILKPAGWTPPNVKQEIIRQTNQGGF